MPPRTPGPISKSFLSSLSFLFFFMNSISDTDLYISPFRGDVERCWRYELVHLAPTPTCFQSLIHITGVERKIWGGFQDLSIRIRLEILYVDACRSKLLLYSRLWDRMLLNFIKIFFA